MQPFPRVIQTIFGVFLDALTFLRLCLRPTASVAAENLFLRKQLGLFVERKVKPRRATDSIRFTLARLSRWFDWQKALIVVKPDTLIRWHRTGFRLFWKWKSRPRGRPRINAELRTLIVEMAKSNPTWGEERIADELLIKIGIRISPRTVRRYMPPTPQRPADPKQRWMTFVRNHAKAIIACDFFLVVMARFQLIYVFFMMEVDTRKLLHFNFTRHPTADWTLQQFRECATGDEGYRFVIHDRDSIYSRELDASLRTLGLNSQQHDRVADNDNTVRYDNRCLQIPEQTFRFSLARCRVLVCQHLDSTISLHYGPHRLGHYDSQGQLLPIPDPKTGQSAAHAALRSAPMNDPGAKSFRPAGLRVTPERKKYQKRKKVES